MVGWSLPVRTAGRGIVDRHFIAATWAGLAATRNLSLRWPKGLWAMAAAFGAVGGPRACYVCAKLGGVAFAGPIPALASPAIGWWRLTSPCSALSCRYDGFTPDAVARMTASNGSR